MTATSLNLSDRTELNQIADALRVIAGVADDIGLRWFVVGATARDLILVYGYGIPTSSATEDVDIGIQVESWKQYNEVSTALRRDSDVEPTDVPHKFLFQKTVDVYFVA